MVIKIGRGAFRDYITASYLKTASLIANTAKGATILAECPEPIINAAYRFGKHLGIAYQVKLFPNLD